MSRRGAVAASAASIAWPATVVAAGSFVAALASAAPPDRAYVPGAAAWASVTEIALGLAASLVVAPWVAHRGRALAPVATGSTVFFAALFVLASRAWDAPAAFAIAAGSALVAYGVRRLAPAPRDGGAIESLLGPPAIAVATMAAGHIGPFGAIPGAAAGVGASVLLGRVRPAPAWIPSAVPPALLVAACVAGLAVPRPFPSMPPKQQTAPDVLLIVLDTLRADHATGASLASLAGEGTRWTNAFSTSSWTVPSHASLFTGLLPQAHGADWEDPYLPHAAVTLAERFAKAGYRTAGFSANPWITPEFAFDQGFERFVAFHSEHRPWRPWSLRYVPALWRRLDAAALFDDVGGLAVASEASEELGRTTERPAFVFLNLLETHLAYHAPLRQQDGLRRSGWSARDLDRIDQSGLRGLLPGTAPSRREWEGMRGLYAAAASYDDLLVGRIVDRLREAGRLDRTIVVVVGDHGENLGDHAPLDHQLGVWDSLLHIPLIVRFPGGVPPGAVRSDLVSIADVAPAVAALAGIGPKEAGGPMLGGPAHEEIVFSYARPGEILDQVRRRLGVDPAPWDRRLAGVRTAGLKYVAGSDGSRALYDVAADPLETRNLLDGPPDPRIVADAGRLAARLSFASSRNAVLTRDDTAPMSEETRAKLRALGYTR